MARFLGIAAVATLLVVALLAVVWRFQRRLIYMPWTGRVPPVESVLPGGVEATIRTADGLALGGWYMPHFTADRQATVAFFPGNAGDRSMRAPLAQALAERGIAVLLVDFRGYGGNPGNPTEGGLLEDARAARAWLEARPDVDPERIVLIGESLGAAVAVAAAAERSPAALILRSPFTSMIDVGGMHYPFLPVRLLLTDRFRSDLRILEVSAPLLVVAGEADRIVPASMSRELFELAPSGTKEWLAIDQAGHNDYELLAGAEMIEAIVGFVERTVPIEEN